MKNIKKLKVKKIIEKKIDEDKLNKQYKKYMLIRNKLNNNNTEYFSNTQREKNNNNEYLNIDFKKYSKNNINNKHINKYTRRVEIFNKLDGLLNKKGQLSKIKKYEIQNIVEDYSNYLDSKKVYKNLLKPNYFFTPGYNEKIKPSQIRHWTSSIYNFLNIDRINYYYLDNYTSKLIKLFFNVKYLKKRLT
jgi:hypothetical protein